MSKLDATKEEIGYLKLWLGIAVVTDISLFSWLITSVGSVGVFLTATALAAVTGITGFAFTIHKQIEKRIDDLEDL